MVSAADGAFVRLARPEEAAECQAIEIAGATMFAPHLPPDAPLAEPYSIPHFAQAADDGRLLVIEDGAGMLRGFALLIEDDEAVHIAEIDVLPDCQGRGLGARLLDGVSVWGAARGLRRITLTTFRHVPFNQPYYERRGFAEIALGEGGPALQAEAAFQATLGYGPESRSAMAREIKPERASGFDSAGAAP